MFALDVIFMLIVLLTPIVFRGQNVFVGGLTWDRYVEHIAMNWNLIPLGYFLPTLFPRLRRFRAFLLTVVIACACLGFWVTRTLTPATNRNSRK